MPKKPYRYIPRNMPVSVIGGGRDIAWEWTYYGGHTPSVVTAQGAHVTPDTRDAALRERKAVMANRPGGLAGGPVKLGPLAPAGSWAEKFPLLLPFMVDQVWEDGSARQPAKLFINVEPGKWSVTLKEPNLGLLLSVSVESPDQLLNALESALGASVVPWQHDPWSRPRGARKGK